MSVKDGKEDYYLEHGIQQGPETDSLSSYEWVGTKKYWFSFTNLGVCMLAISIVFIMVICAPGLWKHYNHDTVCDNENSEPPFYTPPENPFKFSYMFDQSLAIKYPYIEWIGTDATNEGWIQEIVTNTNEKELIKYSYSQSSVQSPSQTEVTPEKSVLFPASAYPQQADRYMVSPSGTYILFGFEYKQIYRHSYFSSWQICNVATTTCSNLTDSNIADIRLVVWSGNDQVAYVRGDDVYIVSNPDAPVESTVQLTEDGADPRIINGAPDWVYEEEIFSSNSASYWSTDSRYLAFLKFNQDGVPKYNFTKYNSPNTYPELYEYHYPCPGSSNSKVSMWVYDTVTEIQVEVPLDSSFEYIAAVQWANDTSLAFRLLNREQNKQELFIYSMITETTRLVNTQTSNAWTDSYPNFLFINQGNVLVDIQPHSNYKHIVLVDVTDGKHVDVTEGWGYDVQEILGFNEAENLIFFSASNPSALHMNIFSVRVGTKVITKMSQPREGEGDLIYATASFSPSRSYYVLYYKGPAIPATYMMSIQSSVNKLTTLETNQAFADRIATISLPTRQYMQFYNADGVKTDDQSNYLNGIMYLPNADVVQNTKKYPVLLYAYGGPDSQTVNYRYDLDYWNYFSYLSTSLGMIIVSVDGRGTCCRGQDFLHQNYLHLGGKEMEDQISVAHQLTKLAYVDETKIGFWGWSFGGYLAARIISNNDPIIHSAVSVAPVTDWMYYDNVYTERYMRTPDENAAGYQQSSVIGRAAQIPQNSSYLIIHGTADDNVHFQNSANWVSDLIENNPNFNYRTMYFPDKNHSISGKATRTYLWKLITTHFAQSFGLSPNFDESEPATQKLQSVQTNKRQIPDERHNNRKNSPRTVLD